MSLSEQRNLSEQKTSPEEEKQVEIKEAIKKCVEAFLKCLDDIGVTFEEHERGADALILLRAAESLGKHFQGKDILFTRIGRRKIRSTDRIMLEAGEHPGAFINFTLSDDMTGMINVYGGGVGRELVGTDVHDGDPYLRYSHTALTDKVMSKPVNLNLQLREADSTESFSCWIVFQRGQGIRITSVSFLSEENSETKVTIEGGLSVNNFVKGDITRLDKNQKQSLSDQQLAESYAFAQNAPRLEDITTRLVRLTPRPPEEK